MEKLALRGVMWGADKIPDQWFEKIPGGFFTEKKIDSSARREGVRPNSHLRHRDEEYDRRHHSKPTRSHSAARHGERDSQHNHSRHRRYPSNDMRGPDRDRYDSNRRHSTVPHASYHDGPRTRGQQPPYPQSVSPPRREHDRHGATAAGAMAGAGLGAAAARELPRDGNHSPPLSEDSNDKKPQVDGKYIPYGDIYGYGNTAPHARPASPPSSFETDGRYHASDSNLPPPPTIGGRPIPRDPQDYDTYPAANRDSESGYYSYNDARSRTRSRGPGARSSYDDDSYYDDYRSPSRGYDSRDQSPSEVSYYDDHGRRRSRSDSRHGSSMSPPPQNKSQMKDKFDTSKDGMKHSALGAIAGGLLGNEIGGGIAPTAIGLVVGALAGSAYEKREK